jgi:DNA-binding NtrC family response regulator
MPPYPGSTADDSPLGGMIGTSPQMCEVYRLTRRAAKSTATVLLNGETGTGKELVARAIHDLSARATGPYVRINCGALSESLLESELFGHVKGAFTSANENRTGRFEAAHGGTIFLDEINSMSYKLQVKLLRVLQEHEFERVGDSRTIRVDCRIVAATNRELLDMVDEGSFREDLYYRLNVIPISLPPLRERGDDITMLATYFLKMYIQENKSPPTEITNDAMSYLQSYVWPGNVRELENYIERAIVLGTGSPITASQLPLHVQGLKPIRTQKRKDNSMESLIMELVSRSLAEAGAEAENLYERTMSLVEKELILQVLRMCHGTQTRTATRLGINRNTLHKKIEDYQLQSEAR